MSSLEPPDGAQLGASRARPSEARRPALREVAAALALDLADAQIGALLAFLDLLQRWNATYNLTSVRDPAQMLTQHLADCLAVIPSLRASCAATAAPRLLDVGSGGGLPGAVIAIVCPAVFVACIDSVGKKVAFVRQVAADLRLSNLHAEHARVEHLRAPPFDVITSRAFASLADFTALTRPLLAADGVWMAMKGKHPGRRNRKPARRSRCVSRGTDRCSRPGRRSLPGLDASRLTRARRSAADPRPYNLRLRAAVAREPCLPVRSASLSKTRMARIFCIANQKGGVGKTTTCVNLAAGLARIDRRVLVVDLDPQGNATMGSGIDKRALELSVYDVLLENASIAEARRRSEKGGYDVLGANRELAGAEVELVALERRERRLKGALLEAGADYDFVLIDCPPSLSLLTLNGLCSAHGVIVPMQCEYFALEGLSDLVNTIKQVHANLNPDLQIIGLLRVMFDPRITLQQQVSEQLKSHFGDKVFNTVIPRNVRLAEAPSYGMPGVVFDPASKGAIAFVEFAREMVARLAIGA